MATADWSRSIHLTTLDDSKFLPSNIGLERKEAVLCVGLHFHSTEKWKKSVCKENAANNRENPKLS